MKLESWVVTLQGFHLAASTPVNLNVKTNTVTHLMDPVYMDAMIQTLSQLIALYVVMDNSYQTKRVQTVLVIVKMEHHVIN